MTKPRNAEKPIKLDGLSLITNVPKPTLAQRFDRGLYKSSRRDKSNGSGRHKEFCRETIIGIAIAQRFIELGVGVGPATTAAAQFTDNPSPGRPAGELFPQDRTVLCIRPTGPVVVNLPYDADFCDLGNHATAFVAVDCGMICKEVDEALSQNNLK
jgi:hypothetical protein